MFKGLHTCCIEKYSWLLKSNVCEVAIHSNSFIGMYKIGEHINSNLLSVFIDVNLYCQCDAINRIGRLNGRPYEFCNGMYPASKYQNLWPVQQVTLWTTPCMLHRYLSVKSSNTWIFSCIEAMKICYSLLPCDILFNQNEGGAGKSILAIFDILLLMLVCK